MTAEALCPFPHGSFHRPMALVVPLCLCEALRAALTLARSEGRKLGLEEAARLADTMVAEQEEQWENAGGEEGSPENDWFRHVTEEQWARQCARYSGSGGADAAEEVAKQIRSLADAPKAP